MALNAGGLQVPATGFYEWVLPGFMRSKEKEIYSPIFRIGGYAWRLKCHPQGEGDRVGLYLCYPGAARTPPGSPHCPDTAFALTIKNHTDNDKAKAQGLNTTFCSTRAGWGYEDMIERQRLAPEGFLAEDGSLTVSVDLTVNNPLQLYTEPFVESRADFLSLLDDPGATSDLTVIVGGGTGSAADRRPDSSAAARSTCSSSGSGGVNAGPAMACRPQRSFRVHRAVLAARCPFFRTLFNAGMADSAARELTLPDADPDAFAVLLRHMYGGGVPYCERAVHRAAVRLSDTLLLPKVKEALEMRLVKSADAGTVADDLLWAAGHGREEVLEELVAVYKRVAKDVDPAQVTTLASANPQLAARLIVELGKPLAADTAAGAAAVAGQGGRKRARG